MKITYIAHSGFLVETAGNYFLFDYYKGDIPAMSEEKPLYVFVSHRHEDHFQPAIFRLAQGKRPIKFILSFDLRLSERNKKRWEIGEELMQQIISVKAHEIVELSDNITVETLRSTDEGVAYLVTENGRTIFHAGDLNWWFWEGEDPGWLGTMEANFKREVARIAGRRLDVAFLPLDDRLEQQFSKGMDWYLRSCRVRYAFPMHFWEDESVIERLEALECRKDYDTVICDTAHERQWEVTV